MKNAEFIIGSNYFLFSGLDANTNCPVIQSFVFLGKNIEDIGKNEDDVWFFQDSDSYETCNPYDKSYISNKDNTSCDIYIFTLDNLYAIENFDQLVKSLGCYGYDSKGVTSLLKANSGSKCTT